MNKNIIQNKSEEFALNIIQAYQTLSTEKKEYIMSKQLLKSGTSIGANVAEAQYAQSKADFTSKMSIALKEANETKYWLNLLNKSNYYQNDKLLHDCNEIIRILTAIVNKSKD